MNTMDGKSNRAVRVFLIFLMSFYSVGAIPAKINATDELWQEDMLSAKDSAASSVGAPKGALPDKPVMLDVLDLKNMDILDVFKLISQKSGLNIIAGQNVEGKVTVFLKNIEVGEALRIIVESYGWGYVQDDKIIQIMTDNEYEAKYGHRFGQKTETRIIQLSYAKAREVAPVLDQLKSSSGKVVMEQNSGVLILTDVPEKLDAMAALIEKMDIPVTTQVFNLNYAKANEISAKVNEMLTPSIGAVKFDDRSNRIAVTDTASKMKEIQRLIEAFDQKDKEVLIEAKIMQIVLSDENKLGVNWEGVMADYHSLTLANTFDVLGSEEKHGKVSVGTIAADGYTALVEALEMVGETNILSAPRIMAVHNQEAKILVGSTEPYVTTTTTTPSSGPTITAESVNFIDVGVKLFVTPTIHDDDFITMKIKPEVSSVTSNLTTGNNNTIPIVETSEAETTVNVKDGISIIVGGLIKEETITSTKKVPFFGNIPLLGAAFRSKNDSVRKTEIVIFLTPKIVSGDVGDNGQLAIF